jgi:hypothetical protein
MGIRLSAAAICLAGVAFAQSELLPSTRQTCQADARAHTSAKHDWASAAADIGKGATKALAARPRVPEKRPPI